MANMMKTNIRLRKVAERLNKDKMPREWSSVKKRLFNLNKRRDRYSKWEDTLWKDLYRKGFIPGTDNHNPKFANEFKELCAVLNEKDKIVASINRCESKYNLDSDDLQMQFNRYNTSRRSTSF